MVQKGSQLFIRSDWERLIVGAFISESVGFVLKFEVIEGWFNVGVRIYGSSEDES